ATASTTEAVLKPASLVTKPVAVTRTVAQPYPVRTIPLPSDIQQEFGVVSATDLVAYANAQLTQLGRKSLAEGDYPSNKSNLGRLVKLLRGLRDRPSFDR